MVNKPEEPISLEKEEPLEEGTRSSWFSESSVTLWVVISFIAGISSLFVWWGINAVLAIVTGHIALRKLKSTPTDTHNRTLTLIGLISGYVGLGFMLLAVIFAIVAVLLTVMFVWLATTFNMIVS